MTLCLFCSVSTFAYIPIIFQFSSFKDFHLSSATSKFFCHHELFALISLVVYDVSSFHASSYPSFFLLSFFDSGSSLLSAASFLYILLSLTFTFLPSLLPLFTSFLPSFLGFLLSFLPSFLLSFLF